MNGSGAERAEKGKKKERKKNIGVKMVCFFLIQVTGNYSLPIMFSKKIPPPSVDRFTIPTIDVLSPKKERKKEEEKEKERKKKPSTHNNAAITAATPTTPPTTGTAPRPAAL